MYCMGCGKPTNNSTGYCDRCLNESDDIFIDDSLNDYSTARSQEPLFKDSGETKILDKPDTNSIVKGQDIDLNSMNDAHFKNNQGRQDESYVYNNEPRSNNFQGQEQRKYCVSCGSQLHIMAKQCPQCGAEAGPLNEESETLFGILGCCIPLVGWILYFIWRNTKPKTAKKAMIGGIFNIVLIVLSYIIFIILVFAGILGGSYYYYYY